VRTSPLALFIFLGAYYISRGHAEHAFEVLLC
jgi:hypothetical protein